MRTFYKILEENPWDRNSLDFRVISVFYLCGTIGGSEKLPC